MKRKILDCLAVVGRPRGDYIGHLATPSMIIDAIGYPRTPSSYAAVSRSLKRLCAAGKVERYAPKVATRGNGYRYCLAKAARADRRRA